MTKIQYKQIIINSANKSENIQHIDVFSELKNTEPVLSVENNNIILNMPINNELLTYLNENNIKLFAHLVSSKSHSNFRIKKNGIISRSIYKSEQFKNKTIPIGVVQNKCLKTTDINHSFYTTSQEIYPNSNSSILILFLTIMNYLTDRLIKGKLNTGRFNHHSFKKYSESSYFKFYIVISPSYNNNFNNIQKYKRKIICSKLSIPIVVFKTALENQNNTLQLETIDDHCGNNIRKLYCLTVR